VEFSESGARYQNTGITIFYSNTGPLIMRVTGSLTLYGTDLLACTDWSHPLFARLYGMIYMVGEGSGHLLQWLSKHTKT